MKNANYIEITFENCESIYIPVDRVEKFEEGTLEPLHDTYPEEYGETDFQSDRILLEIRYENESELNYIPEDGEVLGMYIGNPVCNYVDVRPNILARLFHKDTVAIRFIGDKEDDVIKTIYVPWGEEEYRNELIDIKTVDNLIHIQIENIK